MNLLFVWFTFDAFQMILKNIVGYQLEDNEDSL